MKTIFWAWLLLWASSLLAAQPSVPASPQQDIVAVVSTTSQADSASVPGLLAGQRIMDDLQGGLELRNQIVLAAGPHRAENHL